jgi:putative tryptophan/tyrosine transport system substrate-binding protein
MVPRREFLTRLAGVAAAALAKTRARGASPAIGFLSEAAPDSMARGIAAFRQGLGELGLAEGTNLAIDWRSERQPNRLRALAAELVASRVAVIVSAGDLATMAAKTATSTVPIVFVSASDPASDSLAGRTRPPGNVTGLSWFGADLAASRLALIRQLAPKATLTALLIDPGRADAAAQEQAVQAAAETTGLKLLVLRTGNSGEINVAFATLVERQAGALVVGTSQLFANCREQLIALAARHAIPVVYPTYEAAAEGGLASYGHSASDAFRRAGVYTGWILRGARPSDLPVLSSSKLELAINARTAKTLGLELSANLLAGADEVIR